jgi:hypothetical protein
MARPDKMFGGRDSVAGIAICYVLEGSGIEHLSRCVHNFPVPPNVPEAHSSSFKMATSLSKVYRGQEVALTTRRS